MSATRRRTASQSPPEPSPSSLAEWERNSVFTVTGPSGTVFEMRSLTLDQLTGEDALPDDLLRIAMIEWAREVTGGIKGEMAEQLKKGTPEALEAVRKLGRDNLALGRRLAVAAIVRPKVTEAKLAKLDPYDIDMIVRISQRLEVEDATGKKVGADRLDNFRSTCGFLSRREADPARKAVLVELAEIQ